MSYQNPATFAPYTPPPDESKNNRSSYPYSPIPGSSSAAASTSASAASATSQTANPFSGAYQTASSLLDNTIRVNKYETGLPLSIDKEAAATYILGCITGVVFLILEQKNDYVRFHAWQSSLLFTTLFLVHFIMIFISSFISWMLFLTEIALIAFLANRAYQDSTSLARFHIPIFGRLASQWVDNE